jgi:2-succinyl-6-hydroxy-2,4-cyclohexadiene-1-carboxylate synthase
MEANGVQYHVEVDGSGTPLVLLHGFTGSSENWSSIRPILNQQFTTITIDLLGHGQTETTADPLRYGMDYAANDLAVIFGKLDLNGVNLLGYSMGGRLALYTAITHPALVRTLILENASPGLENEAERVVRIRSDDQLADRIETDRLDAFVEHWTNLPLFATQSDELRQRLRVQRLTNNPLGLANSLRGMGTGVQSSLWSRLSEVACPTLLITGESDQKFTHIARQMAAAISNVRVETIRDAGHTVHLEQPEAYAQTITDFVVTYN